MVQLYMLLLQQRVYKVSTFMDSFVFTEFKFFLSSLLLSWGYIGSRLKKIAMILSIYDSLLMVSVLWFHGFNLSDLYFLEPEDRTHS